MEKKLVSEINRSRKIMGLQLLTEVGEGKQTLPSKRYPDEFNNSIVYEIEVPGLPENKSFIVAIYSNNYEDIIKNSENTPEDTKINNYGDYISDEYDGETNSIIIDFGVIDNHTFELSYNTLNLPNNLIYSIMGTITQRIIDEIHSNKKIKYIMFPKPAGNDRGSTLRFNLYKRYIEKQIPNTKYYNYKFWFQN